MVNVTIYKKQKANTTYVAGFHFEGHAGYAESGHDIVCAGVSALVLNLINSIEALTEDKFTCEVKEELGDVDFHIVNEPSEKAALLLDSLVLGITGIRDTYTKYITVNFREV
jgi:hypothetical protein